MTIRLALCWALVFCTSLALLQRTCEAASPAEIARYHADVYFSRTASNPTPLPKHFVRKPGWRKPVWSDQIRDPSGKPLYDISLEPEYDVGGYLDGLNLVLRDVRRPSEYNLLCPDDKCMGLQAFIIVGSDFTHGPEKSIYGAKRTMPVPGRNIVVTATILDAKVSPIPNRDDFQLDTLHLDVSAENAPGSRSGKTLR